MDFQLDPIAKDWCDRVATFMDDHVYPAERLFADQLRSAPDHWGPPPIIADLQARARDAGLWNLFLPGEHGAGLTNLQYASVAELTGRSPRLAPIAFNCAAPDTGNMELLEMFGTPEQQQRWLKPLLAGDIRSAFGMTEPGVASSDATNVETRIRRDGNDYVIDGRKWWTTGAMDEACQLIIVMGKTDPTAPRHAQQSMVLVPRDSPGVVIERPLDVLGFDDREHGGHAEVRFDELRVPGDHLLGDEGAGFAMAQARLGPGRIHHCMRLIGIAERTIELMCHRAASRTTFGTPLAERGVVREWIAESRVRLEQLRLLVLKTAWLMDTVGNRGAHTEIQAIKISAPRTVEWILDKAIQLHGGAGLSQDVELGHWFAIARALRLADGPDEVHLRSLGRSELRRQVASTPAGENGAATP